jgi:N-acetylglucosaminyldiphosphoundecaprenol N-acetyl-beta-D-mannosaminyltransferase
MKKRTLISLDLSIGNYQAFLDAAMALTRQPGYVCVANVHMLVEAWRDPAFAAVVRGAVITTPDGKPLTWALRLLYGIQQERIAGMDLLPDLLDIAEQRQIAVFFYGGEEAMLRRVEDFIRHRHPKLHAGFHSPPFRPLSEAETDEVAAKINAFAPGWVFVCLGCPKQEKWMAAMQGRTNGLMFGIGGALPVLAGKQRRAPRWVQQIGLEWLFRLGQEPRRLFRRYLITNTIFLYLLIVEYCQVKLLKKIGKDGAL